jgi:hypothetical protein
MIPKSLHTVTALVNLARHLQDCNHYTGPRSATAAAYVSQAAVILGYGEGALDTYNLMGKAAAALAKVQA